MSRPSYTHLTVECMGCPASLLDSSAGVRRLLRGAAKKCQLHVVKEGMHHFRPQGITGYVLLAESHISVHTWPEEHFALVDVLSCAPLDTEGLVAFLKEKLRPTAVTVTSHTKSRTQRRS